MLAIAQHPKSSGNLKWVSYAGLQDHPDHALAQNYLSGKAS